MIMGIEKAQKEKDEKIYNCSAAWEFGKNKLICEGNITI